MIINYSSYTWDKTLELPHIKGKRSYGRDSFSVKTLRRFFSGKAIKDVTINQVKAYREKQLEEKSYRKQKPALLRLIEK